MKSDLNMRTYLFIFLASILLHGCDIINPAETIPARIQVNPIELQMQPGQGSSRHKITDLWVYADNSLIGVYNPPAEIHYITDAALTNFIFRPGIRNDGILDDAIIYPMLTEYAIQLPSTPGTLSIVNPVTRYKPEAVFSLIADFETHNEFNDNRDTVPESMLVRSDFEPFEGNYSGEIIMTPDAYLIDVGNSLGISDLPTDGTPVYLEFHYRSEIAMSIGLLGISLTGQTFSNYFYVLLPSENWNKIHIELTEELQLSDLPAYKILFRSFFDPVLPDTSYRIQLDNIKVVHL